MKIVVVAPLAEGAVIVDRSRVWEAAYGAAYAIYYTTGHTWEQSRELAARVAKGAVESLDRLEPEI